MQREKERTRDRPQEDNIPERSGPVKDTARKKDLDEAKKKAKKIQKEIEKARERVRQRDAQIEEDDQEVRERYRQDSGQ
jgi:hypothetical protein